MGDHDHHYHGHGHGHGHSHNTPSMDWRFAFGAGLNLAFVVVEAITGVISGSTALLADAGHNLSDVLGLVLAGFAVWLARRPMSARRTYGFGKATVLAALANALGLVFACGAIVWEALHHLAGGAAPASGVMMIVAGVGVIINAGTALMFLKGRAGDANVRGAFVHMAADAAVSVGVIAAGAAIWLTGAAWIDTLASLVIVAVILLTTWDLLKETLDLAMDAAPRSIDVEAVRSFLAARPGVITVHDLHIWPISTTETALTAHLVRPDGGDDEFISQTVCALRETFGLGHATLQVERESLPDCQAMHA